MCVLAAALLCSCATPRLDDPAQFARTARADTFDAAHFDFASAGFFERDQAARVAWYETAAPLLVAATADESCRADMLHAVAARPWARLASDAASESAWRGNVAALRTWVSRLDTLVESRLRGEADAHTPSYVRNYQTALAASTEPRVRQLFERAIRDQAYRAALEASARGEATLSDSALPAAAQAAALDVVVVRIVTTDCDNTAWLRAQLRDLTWFDIPSFGEQADIAASLIAIHADNDPAFQIFVAQRLEALPNGSTGKIRMANLYDRALTSMGRPQRYGLQGECDSQGAWRQAPIEDSGSLDQRRAAAGLTERFAAYDQEQSAACRAAASAPNTAPN